MEPKVLIVFDGHEGGTVDRMARVIATGVREAGLKAICETAENATVEDFLRYDAILLGSPCYFAAPSARIKHLMDASYALCGKLAGKVGGAFTASEHIGGGNELTLRAMHDFFLIHGMIIQGDPEGDHFGPVAVNPSGEQADVIVDDSGECHRLGVRVANLVKKLAS